MDISWDDNDRHARIMHCYIVILRFFSLYAHPLICYHDRDVYLSRNGGRSKKVSSL